MENFYRNWKIIFINKYLNQNNSLYFRFTVRNAEVRIFENKDFLSTKKGVSSCYEFFSIVYLIIVIYYIPTSNNVTPVESFLNNSVNNNSKSHTALRYIQLVVASEHVSLDILCYIIIKCRCIC